MFFEEKILPILYTLLKGLIILAIGFLICKYVCRLLEKALKKSKLDVSLQKFLIKAATILIYIIVLLSALSALGISTSGLLAALSASAVAVALALKDSLSNIAGGILLLVSPRFSTDDYIEENGEGGTVISVDLMHTTILTPDRRQVAIPNGVLINSQIINYSREETRRVDLSFPISYSADVEKAKQTAIEVCSEHKKVLKGKEYTPFARVSGYTDSAVTLSVKIWSKTADYWDVYFDLTEQIRERFNQNGIEIPFNQLDVNIKRAEKEN